MMKETTQSLEPDELKNLSDFAGHLADLSSRETLQFFRNNPEIENKSDQTILFDPVTIADKKAEEVIVAEIAKTYPSHGILGEETGATNNTSEYQWVIDPIDGTGSYICGLPLWGTLIGLMKKNAPVLGIMDQPFLGERYLGSKGKSVRIIEGEEKNLTTSDCRSLSDARLATTSPNLFAPDEKPLFENILSEAKLCRYGTDCSAYALLASGHIDIVVEAGLNSYDILALIPIIEGAGGVVTTWNNSSAQSGGQIVAAATPELHAETLKILSP